ncbi:MAG: hypothetical protein Q9197_006863, partial [Variospora fuerteventurae]
HVDPLVTPLTILVPFRTDIWTHPKRDAVPTPPTSPKMVPEIDIKYGQDVDEAVERVRKVLRLDSDGKKGKDLHNDEDGEGEQDVGRRLPCFGSCLGLRGGNAGEGYFEGEETLAGDGESGGEGQDECERIEKEKTLAENERAILGARRLGRADPVGKVRPSGQRSDVDAESAYQ